MCYAYDGASRDVKRSRSWEWRNDQVWPEQGKFLERLYCCPRAVPKKQFIGPAQ